MKSCSFLTFCNHWIKLKFPSSSLSWLLFRWASLENIYTVLFMSQYPWMFLNNFIFLFLKKMQKYNKFLLFSLEFHRNMPQLQ